jgi:hypothetical protein
MSNCLVPFDWGDEDYQYGMGHIMFDLCVIYRYLCLEVQEEVVKFKDVVLNTNLEQGVTCVPIKIKRKIENI